MILIGELSLWVALLMAAWSAITSFAGGTTSRSDLALSGERAVHAIWVLLLAASAGLWTALFTHDFSFRFVATHTSANLPALYLFASFWAGQAGSLLLWSLILSTYALINALANRARAEAVTPYVTGTLATAIFLLLAVMCFAANPYERLEWMPTDGSGLAPLLQNPALAIHPPVLSFGLLATAIPFAYAIAALLRRRLEREEVTTAHRWTAVAWSFVTLGITLGMWWAYVEPSIHDSWVWDSLRSGTAGPWLLLTASLLISNRQRNAASLPPWYSALVACPFIVMLLTTFTMRNGVIASVHLFSQPPVRGWLAAFFAAATIAIVFLALTRSPGLRSAEPITRASSRLNHYGRVLMGLGISALVLGLAGQGLRTQRDIRLKPGERSTTRDTFGRVWTLTSQGVSRSQVLNRKVTEVALEMSRDDRRAGFVSSEQRQYVDSRDVPTFEPATTAGVRRSALGDLYVVLVNVAEDESAELRISFNPFVVWVWIGGTLIAVAGALVFWPVPSERA